MNYHDLLGADPLDAHIGRVLKNWISSKNQPGEREKQRLLRNVTSPGGDQKLVWKVLHHIPVLLLWVVNNILIGPADQPLTYSIATEYDSSKTSNLMLLMAKQDLLTRLSLHLGVA